MRDLKSVIDVFHKLKYIVTRRQMLQGAGIFLLSLVCAVLELFGVSAIVPLIRAMVSPETLMGGAITGRILDMLNIRDYNGAIWAV